ncbi:hypothetical protein D3C87_1337650 [compost metagenome]
MLKQKYAVIDTYAQQQRQRQHREQLQRHAEPPQHGHAEGGGQQRGCQRAPARTAIAPCQQQRHAGGAGQQQPAHQHAVVVQQEGQIGDAVRPFGALYRVNGGGDARHDCRIFQPAQQHHAGVAAALAVQPQVAQRAGDRIGQPGGQRQHGIGRGRRRRGNRPAQRAGHPLAHGGLLTASQRGVRALAGGGRHPVGNRQEARQFAAPDGRRQRGLDGLLARQHLVRRGAAHQHELRGARRAEQAAGEALRLDQRRR